MNYELRMQLFADYQLYHAGGAGEDAGIDN
jgi:hypothetical protein